MPSRGELPPDPFRGRGDRQNEAGSDVEHQASSERVLLRDRSGHGGRERAEKHERGDALAPPEEDQADHRERRVERGPPISQEHPLAEELGHPVPGPHEVSGLPDRPGRKASADSPEMIHERPGRARDEADRHDRRRDTGDGPDRHRDPQRPRGRGVAFEQPREKQRAAEAGEDQDRRLREPDEHGAQQAGGDTAAARRIRVAQPQRHQGHHDHRGHVDPVLLDLRAVADEGRADREHRHGERDRVSIEHPPRERDEEHERGEAHGQEEKPEREVALPEHAADPLLGDEKAHRRDLVVAQRLGRELRRGAVHEVADERELVEPERRVRGVLEDPERGPHDDQRPEERRTAQHRCARARHGLFRLHPRMSTSCGFACRRGRRSPASRP